MVSVLSTRQYAIAAMVVVLVLLAGLPSPLNPARAQSAPAITLNPTEGAPGTGVTIQGSDWVPGETVSLWLGINLGPDGSETADTIWYGLGEATAGDDGSFTATVTIPAEARNIGMQKVVIDTAEATWQAQADFHVIDPEDESSPPFNPQVTALRFYESGYDGPPPEQRVYAQRFASETSRYINWILDLEHPAPGRRVDFKITAIYLRDNGTGSWKEIWRQTTDAYVEKDWTDRYDEWGYGCDDPPNCWGTGSYRVDIYVEGLGIDGQLLASEPFEIY